MALGRWTRPNPTVPMRALPLFLLATLAACSSPRGDLPGLPPAALPSVGGLSGEQADDLGRLGVPVLVPADPGAFQVANVSAERLGGASAWAVGYRRADGACFEVSGGNDGAGGPEMPLVSTDVRVEGLGRTVRVYQAADDPGATSAQVWGLETVVSDFVSLDGATALFLSDTQGGCRPVSVEEGARIVSGLVLLTPGSRGSGASPTPVTSRAELGAFAPADDVLDGANSASSPRIAADAIARRYGNDADRVTVDVLSESGYEATALVTLYDLRDDSVRDERLLLTYTPVGAAWELVDAGRQVRCQPGRGHAGWSAAACR